MVPPQTKDAEKGSAEETQATFPLHAVEEWYEIYTSQLSR